MGPLRLPRPSDGLTNGWLRVGQALLQMRSDGDLSPNARRAARKGE